ncbi:phage tail protein [Bacillus sp. FJAT-49705]|uniref:Phage tail protein n=1 Tax=Cytobacillus citreus TaxID=2833586 RepID=A0ABS5NLG5_9BACI|nr:major tail protein [Cytobacillus citreus]MBS4188652.1 phage tail protein [Cytobacillus citreus]
MPVIGLRDFYAAKVEDDETLGVPRKLSPAISANITPNYNITTLYGDDRAVEVAEALGDIDFEIGMTDLTQDDYAFLLGKEKNSDGVIEDSADDIAPYVSIGFRIPLSGGGFRYYWYYKGKFNPPTQQAQTKGENVEFQTPTISGKFVSREDGKWRASIDSTDTGVNQSVIDNWFKEVYKPKQEVPGS